MKTGIRGFDVSFERKTLFKRVVWFVGLWLAGVMTLAVVSYLIRWVVRP